MTQPPALCEPEGIQKSVVMRVSELTRGRTKGRSHQRVTDTLHAKRVLHPNVVKDPRLEGDPAINQIGLFFVMDDQNFRGWQDDVSDGVVVNVNHLFGHPTEWRTLGGGNHPGV